MQNQIYQFHEAYFYKNKNSEIQLTLLNRKFIYISALDVLGGLELISGKLPSVHKIRLCSAI